MSLGYVQIREEDRGKWKQEIMNFRNSIKEIRGMLKRMEHEYLKNRFEIVVVRIEGIVNQLMGMFLSGNILQVEEIIHIAYEIGGLNCFIEGLLPSAYEMEKWVVKPSQSDMDLATKIKQKIDYLVSDIYGFLTSEIGFDIDRSEGICTIRPR